MQKVSLILFILLLSTGCSVLKSRKNDNSEVSEDIITEKLLEKIKKQNISERGFFIQKAEINIITENEKQNLIGTIKFQIPDKYLISLKSKAGIEVARIFISRDTILINERINKKEYYGSSNYLRRKFGITAYILPVIFGDYISDTLSDSNLTNCSDGKSSLIRIIGGIKVNYVIDCKKGKSIKAFSENSSGNDKIEINYSSFIKNIDLLTAGKIQIIDSEKMFTIEVKIKKIVYPWDEDIKFIPGQKYELIELL